MSSNRPGSGSEAAATAASSASGIAAPDLPRPKPPRAALSGRYVRLEPLDADRHSADLFEAVARNGGVQRHAYLADPSPPDVQAMEFWARSAQAGTDRIYFAVVDLVSGRALGRQSLMRIDAAHGVIEIGAICWGIGLAGTRGATEALYLSARHVFDDLGYRRFEWKCNDRNDASKRAARRFGFTHEGLFRQHMWVKGANRDTAWFSMLDREWPAIRAEFERWLEPSNFDAAGRQRSSLRVG